MAPSFARGGRRTTAMLLGLAATLALVASSSAAGDHRLTAAHAKLVTRIDQASEHAPHALTLYPAAAQSYYASFHPAFTVHYEQGKLLSFGIPGKPSYGKKSPADACWQKSQKQPPITEVTAANVMLPGPSTADVTYTFPKRGVIRWHVPKHDGLPASSGTVNYSPYSLRIMSGTENTGFVLRYTVNYATVMPEPRVPPGRRLCPRSSAN